MVIEVAFIIFRTTVNATELFVKPLMGSVAVKVNK